MTDVVQRLPDGTRLRHESRRSNPDPDPDPNPNPNPNSTLTLALNLTLTRHESRRYRLGVAPHILSLPDGEAPPPRPPLRFCGWRPFALPYWVAWSFLLGSINFIVGSFCWMVPGVGDSEHGAPAWEVL